MISKDKGQRDVTRGRYLRALPGSVKRGHFLLDIIIGRYQVMTKDEVTKGCYQVLLHGDVTYQ